MKSHEIRSSFLDFFAERGHRIVPSSSLIPHDDPTLLFTNAGMNQFKNVFLGPEKRDYKRATSSQKCLRAGGKHNDLENVGYTARHNTFFEMLGNFSFGDYFKKEAIAFAWDFVTRTLGLDPRRLYATVFDEDGDAERLWRQIAPELGSRVLRFGEKDNYWSMGETGPCGPCSEIHYDRGEAYPGELNGDGDRFSEVWNLVFMQFNRDESKNLTPLPRPSVDTGAGLERFSMVLENVESNYETDLFWGLIEKIASLSDVEYTRGPEGVSHRVIADHVRALAFAIADGGIISNEGRGYVLRRILRRAARHGRLLGLHEPFLYKIVQPLVDIMGSHYTELTAKQGHVELVIRSEEEQFGRTLDIGLEIFEDIVKKVEASGSRVIPGTEVFQLYDTYGFPVDLTKVMARERHLQVDMAGFEKELDKQRERSRKESMFFGSFLVGGPLEIKRPEGVENFVGYSKESIETKILNVQVLDKECKLILLQTPFYAESGGQVSDTGKIFSDEFTIRVTDTQKFNEEHVHIGEVILGDIAISFTGKVMADIDHARRADIQRNHTATHLLHKALRTVLGEHVHQAGSLVAPDRLRFDFTHFRALTPKEIDEVERIVNEKIKEDLPVKWENKKLEEAKATGAMALFGEKYGDIVRVVTTGDNYSVELCGGTHANHTSEIGQFFIMQETAIAAGMRRIEALTGREATRFFEGQNSIAADIRNYLKKKVDKLTDNDISAFKGLIAAAHRRMLQREGLAGPVEEFLDSIEKHLREREKESAGRLVGEAAALEPRARIAGERILVFIVPAESAKDLMVFSDSYRKLYSRSAVVTISGKSGNFAITSSDDGLGKQILKIMIDISAARGGGKPTIRGTMPVEKIASFIEELKRRFG